ncbi:MAG TPA: dihydroxyacetone kinase subunit DhaK [Roseiflexaceae bacterium]|nr:dihydroxyacetone kinase subunit DhaK [Roseiflexaceae bacterium]
MKKLINAPDDVVRDALEGFALAHADLIEVRFDPTIVLRRGAPAAGQVALISGGGSGHEPLHAGFVGRGMLHAACPGPIFTSPVPDQMLAAAQAADGGAGVLFIVKNYTGDVMNFEMAAELAADDGMQVASITLNDDVAVRDSLYTAGRRGMGVTVLLEKIVGAAAEAGAALAECLALAERVNQHGRSFGLALTSCTVPHIGHPTFELGEGEMELGIGIHGEPGRMRVALEPAARAAELLLEPIVADLDLQPGERVLAFVNGLGGTPQIELYVMFREVARVLGARGITIARSLVGNYITSLEMAGCTLTLLRLDDEMIRYWDAPVHTSALRWGA